MSESVSNPTEVDPLVSASTTESPTPQSTPSARPSPKIGDSRPAPQGEVIAPSLAPRSGGTESASNDPNRPKRRRRGGRGRGGPSRPNGTPVGGAQAPREAGATSTARPAPRANTPLSDLSSTEEGRPTRATEGPERTQRAAPKRRRGRERNGRPVGRYLMCVHVERDLTQIAVLEGRSLIEHHVAQATDDANQIDGNVYFGRVKNVLPGMEAAFVDIGTPKNAVLYWGDVANHGEETEDGTESVKRIEQLLRPGQTVICQVTKNPIGLKGARLTEEVSLPGRFVVLVPNSEVSGISKRLDDHERRRLRHLLDEIRPAGHGIIVRTAAEGVSDEELRRDVEQLMAKWNEIERLAIQRV